MARPGVARAVEVRQAADHIAGLCEIMAELVLGELERPGEPGLPRAFFDGHIGTWTHSFVADLEAAESASFQRPVVNLGRLFMALEAAA